MTRSCPKCNQLNPPDAAFCLNCSTPLSPSPGGTPFQTPNPPYVGQQTPYVGQQAPYVGAPPAYAGGSVNTPQVAGGAGQRAIIALVLAIVGLLCCGGLAGIPAAIVGWLELDAIKNGKSPAAGKWMAQVGLWGGIAVTVLHGIGWVIYILLVAMAGAVPY